MNKQRAPLAMLSKKLDSLTRLLSLERYFFLKQGVFLMLNDRQKEIVESLEQNLLVIAGAGSGKTRCITARAGKIAESGVDPKSTLIVTFTNKAASELKERLKADNSQLSWPWVGTFHSICARILRLDGEKIGVKNNFTITDSKDQRGIAKSILKDLSIDHRKFSYVNMMFSISNHKNKLVGPEDYAKCNEDTLYTRTTASIYRRYQALLENNNSLDFDDLLMKTVQLLRKEKAIREKYRKMFRYIMVDEFQDTNFAQYELLKNLYSKKQNICVVGDDDQSIYSWRGANFTNLFSFEEDFAPVKVIKLEQNYRSTPQILDLANCLIKNNTQRHEKNLIAREGVSGGLPSVKALSDEYMEAKFIVKEIKKISNYQNTAILYRINSQSRILENVLIEKKIPYVVRGGTEFFARSEIKDIISYLKVLYNPSDIYSLQRIINVPTRGIGAVSVNKMLGYLRENDKNFLDLTAADQLPVTTSSRDAMLNLVSKMRGWQEDSQVISPLALVEEIVADTKLIDFYERKETDTSISKGENIHEFLVMAENFCENFYKMHGTYPLLSDFLESISLQSSVEDDHNEQGKVQLMTIHNSKGLEFDNVFILGVEEGILPHHLSMSEQPGLQEERRLLYVAITRAKKNLVLTFCRERRKFAAGGFKTEITDKSRFLEEFDKRLCKSSVKKQSFVFGKKYEEKERKASPRIVNLGGKSFYKVKDIVVHKKFGQGEILSVSGSGQDAKLTISFNNGELKKIVGTFVEKM